MGEPSNSNHVLGPSPRLVAISRLCFDAIAQSAGSASTHLRLTDELCSTASDALFSSSVKRSSRAFAVPSAAGVTLLAGERAAGDTPREVVAQLRRHPATRMLLIRAITQQPDAALLKFALARLERDGDATKTLEEVLALAPVSLDSLSLAIVKSVQTVSAPASLIPGREQERRRQWVAERAPQLLHACLASPVHTSFALGQLAAIVDGLPEHSPTVMWCRAFARQVSAATAAKGVPEAVVAGGGAFAVPPMLLTSGTAVRDGCNTGLVLGAHVARLCRLSADTSRQGRDTALREAFAATWACVSAKHAFGAGLNDRSTYAVQCAWGGALRRLIATPEFHAAVVRVSFIEATDQLTAAEEERWAAGEGLIQDDDDDDDDLRAALQETNDPRMPPQADARSVDVMQRAAAGLTWLCSHGTEVDRPPALWSPTVGTTLVTRAWQATRAALVPLRNEQALADFLQACTICHGTAHRILLLTHLSQSLRCISETCLELQTMEETCRGLLASDDSSEQQNHRNGRSIGPVAQLLSSVPRAAAGASGVWIASLLLAAAMLRVADRWPSVEQQEDDLAQWAVPAVAIAVHTARESLSANTAGAGEALMLLAAMVRAGAFPPDSVSTLVETFHGSFDASAGPRLLHPAVGKAMDTLWEACRPRLTRQVASLLSTSTSS